MAFFRLADLECQTIATDTADYGCSPFADAADAFRASGYCVVPRAVGSKDLQALRKSVLILGDDFVNGRLNGDPNCVSVADVTRRFPERNPGIEADALGPVPYILGGLIDLRPAVAAILAIESLWEIAAALLPCDVDDVVYHFSNLTQKPRHIGPAVGWHRDYPNEYFCPSKSDFLRLLIPLQPMSRRNGGTTIVAGSHRLSDDEALQKPKIVPPDAPECPSLCAGDALALHSKVVHGGGPNRSASDRDVLVIQFGIAGQSFAARHAECLSGSDRSAVRQFVADLKLREPGAP